MRKILLIEDEDTLRNIVKNKLLREGFNVEAAVNGEEGLEKMKATNPDLVLLDIIMPKMDGFGVLKEMKEDPQIKDIPVIIISNSGQPVEIEKAKEFGVKDYLIKADFTPEEVMEKVYKQIEREEENNEDSSSEKEKQEPEEVATEEPSPDPEKKEDNSSISLLVVEDDAFLRDLIVKKLKSEKFNVTQAVDGEEGYEKAQEVKPDLILLDLILPGIDGFQVLKQIKENSETKDVPVVILSNLGQQKDIEKGMELGAKDFLIKASLTPAGIVEKIKSLLNK